MEQLSLKWHGGMEYTADLDGHTIRIDADGDSGGTNLGPRPKALILVALAGCTGMDIASLARKMRVEIEELEIKVEYEKSEEHPIVYTSIHLVYQFRVADSMVESYTDKILKMVNLSQERYCGVSAMLRPSIPLSYSITINGKQIFLPE